MKLKYSLTVLLFAFSVDAVACKERPMPDNFPINEIEKNSIVVRALVIAAEIDTSGAYEKTKSFKAKVVKSYQSNLVAGAVFEGTSAEEAARAVCPVHLSKNFQYVMVLQENNGVYAISRFTLTPRSDWPRYGRYKKQLDKAFKRK